MIKKLLQATKYLMTKNWPITGSSLLEMMVGTAILGIVAIQVLKQSSSIVEGDKKLRLDMSMEKIAMDIYKNVDNNFQYYQIDFNQKKFENKSNVYSMAWNTSGIYNIKDCPNCQGKAGVILSPINKLRGLFVLTIRLSHSELFLDYKDYTFLINDQ